MTGLSSGIYHVIVSDSANLCSVDTTITLPMIHCGIIQS